MNRSRAKKSRIWVNRGSSNLFRSKSEMTRNEKSPPIWMKRKMGELIRELKAVGFRVQWVGEEGKRHIEFEFKPTTTDQGKLLPKQEEVLDSPRVDRLLPPLILLKSINRELRKPSRGNRIEFWQYRTAEDVVKLVYHFGRIPPHSLFITETIRSWIRESRTECLIDLGRALDKPRKKTGKRQLPRVQVFPYVSMNRAYDTLTRLFAVTAKIFQGPEFLTREDRVLLAISQTHGLSLSQVRQILFERAPFHRYFSPFTRLSTKEPRITEWEIWQSFRAKKEPLMTDRQAFKRVAAEKKISVETVRQACKKVKAIFDIQRKATKAMSDRELEQLAQEHTRSAWMRILSP